MRRCHYGPQMQTSHYVYDQAWDQERARLAALEAVWDAGTHAVLTRYGVGPGCKVLEAGAGGGSVVSWLADQVTDAGRVLAVDLDTRFVEPLASRVVEVRQANLVTDDLPAGEFDLVHCRMVLEHIPEHEQVLARLVRALRPSGRLVVEDLDWASFGIEDADEADERGANGILDFMGAAGFDRVFGRRLVSLLVAQGLERVTGEGRSFVLDASHPGFAFFGLSFAQLAPAAVDAGHLTKEDADVVGERLQRGDKRVITPSLIAAVGRKPQT